jgi:hypothetical protein
MQNCLNDAQLFAARANTDFEQMAVDQTHLPLSFEKIVYVVYR